MPRSHWCAGERCTFACQNTLMATSGRSIGCGLKLRSKGSARLSASRSVTVATMSVRRSRGPTLTKCGTVSRTWRSTPARRIRSSTLPCPVPADTMTRCSAALKSASDMRLRSSAWPCLNRHTYRCLNRRRWKKPAFSCGSGPMARSTLPASMSSRKLVAVVRTVLSDTPGATWRRRSTSGGRKTISPMSVMPIVTARFTLAGSKRLCWFRPLWIMPSA